MNRSDTVRRAVSLTLAVLCLLVVPQVAQAAFSTRQAPALTVGTASVVTPTAVSGTYTCRFPGINESISVTVDGLTATAQLPGVTYTLVLLRGATQVDSASFTGATVTLSSPNTRANPLALNTTYRLVVTSRLGTWTAADFSRDRTCGPLLSMSGAL